MSMIFIRWRAWWFNKIPLSITLVLLLTDGGPLRLPALLSLALVVLTVCAVGNYGYAINDLYDLKEDARVGRANAAAALGVRRTAVIVVLSAIAAETLAWAAAGGAGAGLTLAEIVLPFVYSAPPFRIKERKWLGIAADGLAAHVYPAVLALMTVVHLGLRPAPWPLVACLLAWSAAAGARGILSHQLHTAERDRQGGLVTVVHDLGRLRLERFIVFVLLPIEAVGFIVAAALCDGGPVLWTGGGLYLAMEAFQTLNGGFTVKALRPERQPYLPFLEERFYKAWGPVVLALDAARVDIWFLGLIPLYALLFTRHLRAEGTKLRAVWQAISRRLRRG